MIHRKVQTIVAYWVKYCHAFLFYTLLLTLIAIPVLATLGFDGSLLWVFLIINLVATLMGIRSRRLSLLLLSLLSITFAIRLAAESANLRELVIATTFSFFILAFIATSDALRSAISAPKISTEHLYAALSVYMLAGVLFGVLHWEVGQEWPGAYSVPQGEELSLQAGIYFSFVTQATLGYGDVLPKSDLARGLAILQTVVGQLYLVVMVARLVSLYAVNPRADQE
jgi:voltage-gated potassium channel